MRIVSLLPSLTEWVAALGRLDDLVGISHECDWPSLVNELPRLTSCQIQTEATSTEIDAQVVASGPQSLYEVDADRLLDLVPDLILTQAQCEVCAVSESAVRTIADSVRPRPLVVAVNPTDLAGITEMVLHLGDVLQASEPAEDWLRRFDATCKQIASARRTAGVKQNEVAVAMIEWIDPIYTSGHWNPELFSLAGGREQLATPGQPSRRIHPEQLVEADPEVLVVAPCGFDLERTRQAWREETKGGSWSTLRAVVEGRVMLVDANSYFARPGPRLEASLRIASAALAPEACEALAPPEGWAWIRS